MRPNIATDAVMRAGVSSPRAREALRRQALNFSRTIALSFCSSTGLPSSSAP